MDNTLKGGIALVLTGLLAMSAPASAQFYAGGGIGDGTIESSENTPNGSFNFDESDFAWKIFGGYMFSEYLGVEVAYFDMGSPSQNFRFDGGEAGPDVNVSFNAEMTGLSVHGVLGYPFGPFEVFGKLGVVSYDAQLEAKSTAVDAPRIKADDDGEELAYGLGAKYNIDNFALRAEWDIYDTGDVDDVSMWTIGAEVSF